jgi:Arc/MetJ-type ribon-helix-helix transcriptional regulator
MSTQIAVRLPDEIVAFLDEQVDSGAAASRAAVVTRALERERRRAEAEQDARIYAAGGSDDLDALAAWAGGHALDLD